MVNKSAISSPTLKPHKQSKYYMRLTAPGAFDYFNALLMVLLIFVMLYPFWYVTIISFNDNSIVNYQRLVLIPRTFTLENYRAVFFSDVILRGFAISVGRTVIGTLAAIFCNAALAYGLINKNLPFRKFFLTTLTITMFFGGGLIPTFMLWRALGLVNTAWLFVVPGLIAPFTVMMMKAYYNSAIPSSVTESAQIDGANEITIFFRLIIPMSVPMLATFALFAAVGHWNDWGTAEFFIQNRDLHPLATVLRRFIFLQEAIQNLSSMLAAGARSAGAAIVHAESVKMAAVIISVLPIICVYPFLQKYFVHGLRIGSIKE